MQVIVIVCLGLASCLLQTEARTIAANDELPKALQDMMEQSFSCAMKIGPRVTSIPRFQGIQLMPEDNEALNEFWGCIWIKKGIINEAAEVNLEGLKTYLVDLFSAFEPAGKEQQLVANQIANECKDVNADNYGLRAVKIQNCINASLQEKINDE